MQLKHVNIIPKMGVLPLSHMGHKIDLLPTLQRLGGYSYVNLAPNAAFAPREQRCVIACQWQDPSVRFCCYKNVGDFLRVVFGQHVFNKINIVVGQDRVRWGERIVDGLKRETFKELECRTSDIECEIVVPETYRDHGYSGTAMREAALLGDYSVFHHHVGDMFSVEESRVLLDRTRLAIVDNVIPLKRKSS